MVFHSNSIIKKTWWNFIVPTHTKLQLHQFSLNSNEKQKSFFTDTFNETVCPFRAGEFGLRKKSRGAKKEGVLHQDKHSTSWYSPFIFSKRVDVIFSSKCNSAPVRQRNTLGIWTLCVHKASMFVFRAEHHSIYQVASYTTFLYKYFFKNWS